jgi:Arc/MetJ family transcription regulator
MRNTLNINDQLLAETQRVTGVSENVALVGEGLRALIAPESSRRLEQLDNSEPQLKPIPRRKSEPAE